MSDKEAPPPVVEERIEDIIDRPDKGLHECETLDCLYNNHKPESEWGQDEPGDTTQG